MYGKAHGTHQHQQVAGGQREAALDTQQVQGYHAQHHGDPHRAADLPAEEQAEQGNQHHIQRRDEARLAGVGAGHQTRLLEVGGDSQSGAAAEAAQPQLLAGGLLFLRRGLGPVLPSGVHDGDHHQQRQYGDEVTGAVEGEGPHGVGADILRHEGSTPDKGRQNGEYHLTHLVVFHVLGSFLFIFSLLFRRLLALRGVDVPLEFFLRSVEKALDIFPMTPDHQSRHRQT